MRCGLTWSPWKTDPGPCPVDDTPHTACTPASIAAKGNSFVGPGHRPRTLPAPPAAPAAPAAPSTQVGAPFTTKTYKRQGKQR